MNIFKRKYTLRTYAKQTAVNGYVASAVYKDRTVLLDVQPTVAADLKALPEGTRASKSIKSYGDFPIQTATAEEGYRADRLFYACEWYECVSSSYYEHTPLNHWKSLFVRVPETDDLEEEPEGEETDE